jgi:hypothetical protein
MAAAETAWRNARAEVSIADLAADVDVDTAGSAFPRLRGWLGTRPSGSGSGAGREKPLEG